MPISKSDKILSEYKAKADDIIRRMLGLLIEAQKKDDLKNIKNTQIHIKS